MSEPIDRKILSHLQSPDYRPVEPRRVADNMNVVDEAQYHVFRAALKQLQHEGRVVMGAGGVVMVPTRQDATNEFSGVYRHNPRGFGFVIPSDPASHEDLFIPEGESGGAITGDVVRARVTNREQRQGKIMYRGRITSIIERTQRRFVGSLQKQHNTWVVLPDGNALTEPILAPDAASRHIPPGTKVVVELTSYPEDNRPAQGVIVEVIGAAGEKDVDLRSVIVQFNLPAEFPESCFKQARAAVARFEAKANLADRLDLSDRVICTIDPDDAKDYDDAISLRQLNNGNWELGVHIADVSAFVEPGSALDEEARQRANSCYFPGHVIPMLPEILSNGVCSLQQDVPRLCKSAFITFDDNAEPIATAFANTVIRSASRLRYREAQAIIDRQPTIPHPDGPRSVSEYNPAVIELLYQMNDLARQIQKRRAAQGQIVLNLPEVELILDDNGRVVGAEPEDQSFTHTLIEMFMVEANEAVARLLDSLDVPFLRRTHPDPDTSDSDRLREFAVVSGHKLPKVMDRAALQALLKSVEGKPESFAINLAVLKSLTRAEYSPQRIGHFALASKHYCHFTSPIRRYADLTIHRLLDAYFQAGGGLTPAGGAGRPARKVVLENVPTYDELVEWGRHLSFNERRADDAERELRKIKLLELLQQRVGEEFQAVVTGIANFGIFAQIRQYLIDGLIRYEDLMDDWWDVDARSGRIRGQRTGRVIRLGDPCIVRVARVDVARRELVLAITELIGRPAKSAAPEPGRGPASHPKSAAPHAANATRPAKKAGRRDRDSSAGPHILAPFGKAGMTHDEGSTRGGPRGGAPRGGGPTGGGRRSGRAQSSNGGSRPNSVKGKNRGGGGRRSGKPKPPRR